LRAQLRADAFDDLAAAVLAGAFAGDAQS